MSVHDAILRLQLIEEKYDLEQRMEQRDMKSGDRTVEHSVERSTAIAQRPESTDSPIQGSVSSMMQKRGSDAKKKKCFIDSEETILSRLSAKQTRHVLDNLKDGNQDRSQQPTLFEDLDKVLGNVSGDDAKREILLARRTGSWQHYVSSSTDFDQRKRRLKISAAAMDFYPDDWLKNEWFQGPFFYGPGQDEERHSKKSRPYQCRYATLLSCKERFSTVDELDSHTSKNHGVTLRRWK